MEIAEQLGGKFETNRLENGDTEKQLLNSSRYLLFKSEPYWTPSQTHNTEILFNRYPALGKMCMKFSIPQKYRLIHTSRGLAKYPTKKAPDFSEAFVFVAGSEPLSNFLEDLPKIIRFLRFSQD